MNMQQLSELIAQHEQAILTAWMDAQMISSALRLDLINEKDLRQQSKEFLKLFLSVFQQSNVTDIEAPAFNLIRQFLDELSSSRAIQGFSPVETATFIFSLKEPLFNELGQLKDVTPKNMLEIVWSLTQVLDQLGLYTSAQYQKSREALIKQQQKEMLELSTPVVKLWEGILMLPLIGTLDSSRTQQVMESLLQKIVETSSGVAIIDITGIPMVDTLVAQHLIKTINAARLMGAECILCGIRPQIAQTIVHLGISLQDVTTKATLADAVAFAMQSAGFNVIRHKS